MHYNVQLILLVNLSIAATPNSWNDDILCVLNHYNWWQDQRQREVQHVEILSGRGKYASEIGYDLKRFENS